MGLFDLFSRKVACPRCGQAGARKSLFGSIRCPNTSCEHFDPGLMYEVEEARQLRTLEESAPADTGEERRRTYRDPRTGQLVERADELRTDYDPGPHRIEIHYTNYIDEEKTFVGDWRTLRRSGNHFSLCVMPTGTRIALHRVRIHNLDQVEAAAARCPKPDEQRVLKYHARQGTTSELCDRLRAKYPEWSPPEE